MIKIPILPFWKPVITTLLVSLTVQCLSAQQLINTSLQHDNETRTYNIYIPTSYSELEPAPLVLNFHGYGSNAQEQTVYADFRPQADEFGFIVVQPDGLVYNGSTHWNVASFTTGSTADDVGFVDALIENLASEYTINLNRVYATGMSNGGYMSYRLACELTHKIAAVASVTGSMGPLSIQNCSPSQSIPVMQIHGTADDTVPFEGAKWTEPIPSVVDYWVEHNNCNMETSPIVIDGNTLDNSSVEHYIYSNGSEGNTVEFYKVLNGGHTWPGSAIQIGVTNYDIDASEEIWRFFSQYDINGLITIDNVIQDTEKRLELFPNPTKGELHFKGDINNKMTYEILSPTGKVISAGVISDRDRIIRLNDFKNQFYFIRIENQFFRVLKI